MSKQARIRTQEMRAAQQEAAQREARRRRIITIVGGLVIVGLLAAIAFAVVAAMRDADGPAGPSGEVVPPANVDGASIPVGAEDAPVTVAIYYDYMCPACGAFEAANGDELDRLLQSDDIRVELRPLSFLDRTSNGTEYSTRAANAIATVADGSPEQVWAFHRALYEEQPEEGTSGLSDEQIADIAAEAGVPAEVVDRFGDRTYDNWVASVTEEAFDSGVEGTPTVLIDGEEFDGDLYTPGPLSQAIASAAGDR